MSDKHQRASRRRVWFLGAGLALALLLAFGVSRYASSAPDGLEKVAVDHGFIHTAKDSAVAGSPLSDYSVRGVDDEGLSTGLAGVVGVVATFGIGLGLFAAIRVLRPRSNPIVSAARH